MILLDTSILSRLFRRNSERHDAAAQSLRALIESDRAVAIPGIVVQELLAGIRSSADMRTVSAALEGFPTLLAEMREHREAARIYTECRSRGVTTSHIDCLIAAQTILSNSWLFTLDNDFASISEATGLKLHEPDSGARK